ncbi:NUDIX domain-containing protein [Streptomyces sp. NPDC005474]|uniref:NUDIX domain-containing protein n=1 Tax=Streptomyces sp. NPDC005474 TaxID=3154878 RepID=UPI00345132D5
MTDSPRRDARRDASVIVARHADCTVAVLAAEFPQHGGEYVFQPGGRREPGETPDECARRELREEAGVTDKTLAAPRLVRHHAGLRRPHPPVPGRTPHLWPSATHAQQRGLQAHMVADA